MDIDREPIQGLQQQLSAVLARIEADPAVDPAGCVTEAQGGARLPRNREHIFDTRIYFVAI